MDRPYVERLRIQNYGCIKDTTLSLTPLHALIGPNDSGKSTVLRALRTLAALGEGSLNRLEPEDERDRLIAGLERNPRAGEISFEVDSDGHTWQVTIASSVRNERNEVLLKGPPGNRQRIHATGRHFGFPGAPGPVGPAVRGSQLLRLDGDALRQKSRLIRQDQSLRLGTRGESLPAVYDAIITRELDAYIRIGKRLATLFPTVKGLRIKNISDSEKALGVQLLDGTEVGADFMSEGMLYYLAYAAIPHLQPTALLLIEEPENGLHPARIVEVMGVLREVSKTTQVILATHSPLVINELAPNEVTVLRRTPELGTKATLIKDTPNFDERAKVYALGELWVSYADGDFEAPLFTPPEPTHAPPEASEGSGNHER